MENKIDNKISSNISPITPNLQNAAPLRLTQTVQKGGCAAKVAAHELRKILNQVTFPPKDQNLLVDGGLFDDAAIYKINDELALVQTLDFFTPIVDSPRIFGRVAAANALSDIYAMGGTPKTAMAILAFPMSQLSNEVAVEVLQGACDILTQAGVPLVGGHSIDDDTLKFGLSVTGYVHPQKIWSNGKAVVGDALILTKALGTGTLAAALKKSEITEQDMSQALASMCQLNIVPQLLTANQIPFIHSATDITGFGLVGHASHMAQASQVTLQFAATKIPILNKAFEMIDKGFLTKAHKTNAQYVEDKVDWSNLTAAQKNIFCDPQTSGGLLLSVAPDQAQEILTTIQRVFPLACIVGQVTDLDIKGLKFY